MKIKLFTIDILDIQQQERELNAFLASHGICGFSKELVHLGDRGYWAFCIEYGEPGDRAPIQAAGKKPTIDYKEVLSPEDFEVFARLREVRKQLAEREDIPVYAVLTNAQLAEMVQKRVTTREQLGAIKGIGDARIAKFADDLLDCLGEMDEGGES